MQILTICFVVCLCGVALATPLKSLRARPSLARNGKNENGGLGIVGGSTASIKKFPYQAAILSSSGILIGSGAIVGKKYILTSAFLIYDYESVQVRVGSASSTEGGQLLTSEKIIIHENFTGGYNYDVALVKLTKAIKYGKTAKPIKMASKTGKNATSAVVSGYGYTYEQLTQVDSDDDLSQGNQNVIARDTCQNYYTYIVFDDTNSCAYSSTVCACSSDIGDPLVQKNKLLGWYLGGSWCCYDSDPQVYSSVPAVNKWVKDKMKGEGYNIKEDIGHYYGGEE